jgi:hypothetical protein
MMNKATAQELKLLREIAHYFLDGETCHFCGKPLIEDLDKTFGDKTNRPIRAQLTVHHADKDPTPITPARTPSGRIGGATPCITRGVSYTGNRPNTPARRFIVTRIERLFRQEQFLKRVTKLPSGCWQWKGCITKRGYTRMGFRFPGRKRQTANAHQVTDGTDERQFCVSRGEPTLHDTLKALGRAHLLILLDIHIYIGYITMLHLSQAGRYIPYDGRANPD